MLQLYHDAEFFLKLFGKLLVHRLFQSLDGHVLHSAMLISVLAFQHFAVVALNAPAQLTVTTACSLKLTTNLSTQHNHRQHSRAHLLSKSIENPHLFTKGRQTDPVKKQVRLNEHLFLLPLPSALVCYRPVLRPPLCNSILTKRLLKSLTL